MADVIQESAIPAEFRAGFEYWDKHREEYMRREWPDATFIPESTSDTRIAINRKT